VTIAPRALRSGFSAACANRKAAVKLVSSTRRHSEIVSRRSGLNNPVKPTVAMHGRRHRVGSGCLVAYIAFDDEDISLAREGAVQSAVWEIDDGYLPSRRNKLAQ